MSFAHVLVTQLISKWIRAGKPCDHRMPVWDLSPPTIYWK